MSDTYTATPGTGWAPTIAMSWLWGLGFFYSLHVTVTYGIAGFLAFAIPNALGLWLFGRGASRALDRDHDFFGKASGPFLGLALGGQVLAVAVSVFAFVTYLAPLADAATFAAVAAFVVLMGCAGGRSRGIEGLRRTHSSWTVFGIGIAAVAIAIVLWEGGSDTGRSALGVDRLDSTFLGLVVPTLVGFALGPWADVQQWQRAAEIRRAGGSVATAYRNGAVLFFGLLCVNAAFALSAFPLVPAEAVLHSDGTPSGQLALFGALAAGSHPASGLIAIWAAISLLTTVDGSYAALRWILGRGVAGSDSPLLALVPRSPVTTPLWWIGGGCALAAAAFGSGDGNMLYLMLPFATLLAPSAATLAARATNPGLTSDCGSGIFHGAAALVMLCAGYASGSVALMSLAPLVGLLSLRGVRRVAAHERDLPVAVAAEGPPAAAARSPSGIPVPAATGHDPHGAFEGEWFTIRLLPTYDDTNSVGNVYFANYVRWVGKARELFFARCMPDFDLKTTDFFILTRSFTHDFKREAAEFDPVEVRIRIAKNNRKFVTLAHEIHGERQGLLGKGEQTLMFVESKGYGLVDIPAAVIKGFLPHFPKAAAKEA